MPITHSLELHTELHPAYNTLILGKSKEILENRFIQNLLKIPENLWLFACEELSKTPEIQLYLERRKVQIHLLPVQHSRHNSPSNADHIRKLCKQYNDGRNWNIILLSSEQYLDAHIASVAKAFPTFSAKTSPDRQQHIRIIPIQDGQALFYPYHTSLIENIQLCANLVDQPPNRFHINDWISMVKKWSQTYPGINCKIIQGESLVEKGLNGLWNVGKASAVPPALICLNWSPTNLNDALKHICWVGKGIIYDTGGLSIKTKVGMPGMKMDMGGAAAVFTAFKSAVEQDVAYPISAILCLAENSVDQHSLRPDDIITMYSGKTVEVNNTDAEGRLVLADGVAWAEKQLNPDIIIDIATLTGAASTSVGKDLAAIYCNNDDLETIAVQSGRITGELCHPLPYIPEKWKLEFQSSVADMRNSVSNRSNAQSACAAQFIGNHLSQKRPWLHIDIAGAASNASRGTGFGVHLLLHISKMLN